jgi:predicted ribosome quality control (RQC) complex YloA/Tae2 family protein
VEKRMSFDGIVTRAVAIELNENLQHGRISKIYQPFKNELILQVRSKGVNYKLLISAHPSYGRVHLTNEAYENPEEPPMFCMLLRKHLDGSVVEKIEQVDLDRMIVFHFQSKNEIGDVTYKKLIVEIMGRHSNIILVDKERNMILDSIKHIPPALSRHRTVLPGHEYVAPPEQHKTNPLTLGSEDDFLKRIDFNQGKIDKQIVEKFSGISPLFAKEILSLSGIGQRQVLAKTFLTMMRRISESDFEPQIVEVKGKEYFYVLPLSHLNGDARDFPSISSLLDHYYFGKADRDRVKQQAADLERFIKTEINKNNKKITKLEKQLVDAAKADRFQLYGELLTANLYQVKRGDKVIEVTNYYDEEGGTITIELNPQKSPSDNAQSFFQKYQKLKNSVEIVKEQIAIAKDEVDYFESLLQQLEAASPKDIEEIREELIEEGYVKKKASKSKKKKQKPKKPQLEAYISSDGVEMLVGKNNKQNEFLTNRLARKNDIWLHTKDIPGSHVVIQEEHPSEVTLKEAAQIAAYFSKARASSQVPVDYTYIRHVKKPGGAKPGYVIYDNQTTLFVTPDEDVVRKLKK